MLQNEQIYFDIAMSLLTVLSMLLVFLGFFCALRFSNKIWSTKAKRMFDVMTLILYIAIIVTGINCLFFINGSLLQQIYIGVRVSYLLDFVIVCMLIAASAIVVLQIYPKVLTSNGKIKMGNKLSNLGFLGFLGFLGLIEPKLYYLFFLFFLFFLGFIPEKSKGE